MLRNRLVLLAALALAAFARADSADLALGGGFDAPHQEPSVWADIPDMAICRKGAKYYMVSTTMHYNPGIPVMVSTNLVDWTVASYCYETAENRPKDRLENGENDYGVGTYASSIRYNESDGRFYVISLNPGIDCTYLFRTRDPEREPWEFHRLPKAQYDASIFFDEGRVYVYASQGSPDGFQVRLTEMKGDFSGFVDAGEIVIPKVNDCIERAGLGEGTQVFKRNGWYYVVNISWGEKGRAAVMHRSRTRKGPWEGRVIFQFQGIAQGSLIESSAGDWYAYFFGDRGAVGRCPYFHRVTWVDDWPVIDTANLPRRPGVPGCIASDTFGGPSLRKEWQWNHNPVRALWSLTDRKGWLRLRTDRTDADLATARNTLTQRTWGPTCSAITKLDPSHLKDGDRAGLALFQRDYGEAAVTREGDGLFAVLRRSADGKPGTEIARERLPHGTKAVYLKAEGDFRRTEKNFYWGNPPGVDRGRFRYSTDGKTWRALGEALPLVYTAPHFTGYRFAVFCYSTKTPGGWADFDGVAFRCPEAAFTRTASEFVRTIDLGINIGNTFDVPSGNEVEWGNRPVTRDLIRLYRAKGINAVRLPVTWRSQFSVDDPAHRIRPEFLDRVQEVVDWCLAEGMVTVLNLHHDGGGEDWPKAWLTIDGRNEDRANQVLADIWLQIAKRFRDYGENLVFEAFNEIRKARSHPGEDGQQAGQEDWSGKPLYCRTVNRYAKTFYDTVRATGGNNALRYLVIPTYAATDYEPSCRAWVHPNPADDHVMVSIHAYEPVGFTLFGDDPHYNRETFGKRFDEVFALFRELFLSKGVPVVIGEVNADLRFYDAEKTMPNDADRVNWAKHYGFVAGRAGCPCFLWEPGGKVGMGLVDRANLTWTHPEIVEAFQRGIKAGRQTRHK